MERNLENIVSRLGDYLDIEHEKEKEVEHGAQVSGLGHLEDGSARWKRLSNSHGPITTKI